MRERPSHYPESVRYLQKPPSIINKKKNKDLKFLEDCYMARAYKFVIVTVFAISIINIITKLVV